MRARLWRSAPASRNRRDTGQLKDGSAEVVLRAYGADKGALRAALEDKYGCVPDKGNKGTKRE